MTLKFNPRTGEWEGTTGGVNINKIARQPVVRKEKTAEDLRAEIMQNPKYSYALKLADHIAREMSLKMGKNVFRNKRGDCYRPDTKQIIFSYENVDNIFERGFTEYVTVYPIWAKLGYKGQYKKGYTDTFYRMPQTGFEAIWMMVVHEMAHALQHTRNNGNFRRAHHDDIFKTALEELIILFPYSEVKEL